MSRDTYKARFDIHQKVRIDELAEDNASLTLQIQDADTAIATLKVEISKLANEQLVLTAKLQQQDGEIGRLAMVINRDKKTMGKLAARKKRD